MTARYAIYYLPDPQTALGRFGCDWLGWDAWTGERLEARGLPGVTAEEHQALISAPHRYGFHATLKAPFRLSPGCTLQGLLATAERFTARTAPVPDIPLKLAAIGRFLALIPAEPSEALNELAAGCVTAFDELREPLQAADRERRRPERLTDRQRAYLDQWGYPYVLEEFRFHLTLTGPLDEEPLRNIADGLRPRVARFIDEPVDITAVALVVQPSPSEPFRLQQLFRLRGT